MEMHPPCSANFDGVRNDRRATLTPLFRCVQTFVKLASSVFAAEIDWLFGCVAERVGELFVIV